MSELTILKERILHDGNSEREQGYHVESLVKIASLNNCKITLA